MEKNIIIDVYDTLSQKVSKDNNFMRFEFKENNKKMQNFIDLCLEHGKKLIIYKNFTKE